MKFTYTHITKDNTKITEYKISKNNKIKVTNCEYNKNNK